MFRLRFNEVFVGLLLMSFCTAFVVPSRFTNPVRSIQGLFYPVAMPARAIGLALDRRFSRPPKDDRSVVDIRDENSRLQQQVATLTAQLDELQRVNADRQVMFEVRKLCTPVPVIGNDAGTRESLALKGGNFGKIESAMPVLCQKGLVGRIDRAGPAGAQVQLITDRNFGVPGKFRRYVKRDNVQAFDPIGGTTPWVQGAGKGNLIVSNIPMSETAAESPNGIAVGDYAVLDDPDPVWGAARGQILGEIVKIQPLPNVRLIAEITLKPKLDFATLREVMVMNKQ
jgi:cell shape-determining protein MreC